MNQNQKVRLGVGSQEMLEKTEDSSGRATGSVCELTGVDSQELFNHLGALNMPTFGEQSDTAEDDTIAYCLVAAGPCMMYICEFDGERSVFGYIVSIVDEAPYWGVWDLAWLVENMECRIDEEFSPTSMGPIIHFWEEEF